MKCPSCGHDNLPGADACEQCQTSLMQEDVGQRQTDIETRLMEEPISALAHDAPSTVATGTTLQQAIHIMRERHFGCVVVVDEEGKLAGILTERDLLHKVAGQELDHSQCLVGDFMSPAPECSKAEHPLAFALHRMIVCDIRYLPIVDEEGRPEGIISSRDVIAFMNERLGDQ